MLAAASWPTAIRTPSTTSRAPKRKASLMQSNNYAYVNGRFVPEQEATVSIFDRGFLYGDGCFETMRVYEGKIFRLTEHLRRLAAGVGMLGLEEPLVSNEIRAIFDSLIERNGVKDGLARIYVTSGLSEFERSVKGGENATVVAGA